jgi:hypothetical protein
VVLLAEAIEGFFVNLTRRRLRRGRFHSIVDLLAAIKRVNAETNKNPKPLIWTADPNCIIDAVKSGKLVIETVH